MIRRLYKSRVITRESLITLTLTTSTINIRHEFSACKTPQQNGVVERKNRTLQEMVRVMLKPKKVPIQF